MLQCLGDIPLKPLITKHDATLYLFTDTEQSLSGVHSAERQLSTLRATITHGVTWDGILPQWSKSHN